MDRMHGGGRKEGLVKVLIPIAVAASVIVASVLIFGTGNSTGSVNTNLIVGDSYFTLAGTNGQASNFIASLYLTNQGSSDSGKIRIVTYVLESGRNLVKNQTKTEIGVLNGRTTGETSIPFSIPVYNETHYYTINFLIFEDDMLILKGSGSIGVWWIYYNNTCRLEVDASGMTFGYPQ